MLTESPVANAVKKSRRQVSKSPARQVEKAKKTAVYLSEDSLKKLGVTSLMEGKSQSQIVDRLIKDHLKRWSLPADRGGAASENLAGRSSEEVSAVA